ncbi:pyruvate kinase [Candidatus Arthromitus sp. SFB-rat-Yit]|uniref:pyruvate kinase n=1 Tax=Candidatus Arthromitus sp. SFB-rat-Yit TaxID=1041504 RepID=UPI000227A733|nr:pyruvate kinase [Candidatus Arthromitus sp. SFB-rat-Yit]BAK80647.1 pyruvate kinase [Candidatus Arthromitus sp. SFB-rat-Yit]
MRKTKIVCTIGPASEKYEILKELIEKGMNVMRLNFSHGDFEEHGSRIKLVREISEELNKNVGIMLDTKGPEIRTKKFEGKVLLNQGEEFIIYTKEDVVGDSTRCSVTYEDLYKDVEVGGKILIDDGLVALEIKNIEEGKITCVVLNSGEVSSNKGVNLPKSKIKLPALTDKDKKDLLFGIENDVEYVAASFIRKADDVIKIREFLNSNGGDFIKIISKIENQEGLDNIDEIIDSSDGIMVARGDLGVEIPIENLPHWQKLIIKKCNDKGKFVITATQMLDSMIRNPRPTRAEASDVANAIHDGSDAVMLSGETANGKYPVESYEIMDKIIITTEQSLDYEGKLQRKLSKIEYKDVPNTIALFSCTTANEVGAKAILACTKSGATAQFVSRFRPECPIISITQTKKVARMLSIYWGVYTQTISETIDNTDMLIDLSVDKAKKEYSFKNGDLIVVSASVPANFKGHTNMLKVHEV